MKIKLAGAAIALALAGALPAGASILHFTLSGVTFDDGGTASGSFTRNTAGGIITDFDVITTPGSVLSGFDYNTSDASGFDGFEPNSVMLSVLSDPISEYVIFSFDRPLTAPGSYNLVTSDSFECLNCSPFRYVTGGSAVAVSGVPEPATWAMMLVGFGGLGGAIRLRCKQVAIV